MQDKTTRESSSPSLQVFSLFKPFLEEKIRVIDLVSCASDEEKNRTMLLYDKKMSSAVICRAFDRTVRENGDLEKIRPKMHELIDEAYNECYAEINKNGPVKEGISVHLEKLAQQINLVKESHSISCEILEIACYKLGILCDLSRDSMQLSDLSSEKIEQLLSIPLTETKLFETLEEKLFCRENKTLNTHSTMPIFSKNGTIGINTILFIIFEDYFPVGFSAKPYPVHTGIYAKSSYLTSQHDYNHAFLRVLDLKVDDPEAFERYRRVYYQLIAQKKAQQIDDLSFKKDLLMLFFLVYEIAYKFTNETKSVVSIIKERTVSLEESCDFIRDTQKSGQDSLVTEYLLLEMIDFIKPLSELGYKIDYDSKQGWKSAIDICNAMLDILDGFKGRHPQILLEPTIDKKLTPSDDIVKPMLPSAISQGVYTEKQVSTPVEGEAKGQAFNSSNG